MSEQPLAKDKSFWDYVDEAGEAAESGGAQFGQLSIAPSRYIHWKLNDPNDADSGRSPEDVSPETYGRLPKKEKSLELMFSIDVKGMNPDLEWTYERKIRPGEKDWHKILKPSIVALKGDDSMSGENYSKTLQELDGVYVEAADVPQSNASGYNTIKLVGLFDSKEACFAAYSARFGSDASVPATAPLSHPEAYTAESWAQMTPHIKAELAAGKAVPDIATAYKVDIPFIAEIAAQG